MNILRNYKFVLAISWSFFFVLPLYSEESNLDERWEMFNRYYNFRAYLKGGRIVPHWMNDGSSFWYIDESTDRKIFYKVDPESNSKKELFDTDLLCKKLSQLTGKEPPYESIPFSDFTFLNGEKEVKFKINDKVYALNLNTYDINLIPAALLEDELKYVPRVAKKIPYYSWDEMEILSPDREWFATLDEYNLWVRSTKADNSIQITSDGVKDYEWRLGGAKWSPDSHKLALQKIDSREINKHAIVRWLGPDEKVDRQTYGPRVGGPYLQRELFIIDIPSRRKTAIDIGNKPNQWILLLAWRPDGSELLFLRADLEFKSIDLMAADPYTGDTRTILKETNNTFVNRRGISDLKFLEDGYRFIWRSDRDGWYHFYLYDLDGNLLQRLTEGNFEVGNVITIDENSGHVVFTACGDRERPYDIHLYRIDLEGNRITQLTEEIGVHEIQFSPSKKFYIDTHSHVGRPPITELRDAEGSLLQTLSQTDLKLLKEGLKWSPPEEFVVKAADGKTNLWGVLAKPYDFDPQKKYPVVERVYTNWFSYVPNFGMPSALTELGFITFVIYERGTPGRGREFLDFTYENIGRFEIEDHLAALKQLAEKHPYIDLNRVGIYGGSWGGYFVTRAMLLAPKVYHVGIAERPYMDLYDLSGAEMFMGLLENNKEGYEYAENYRFAKNLEGKLLIISGTSDISASFSASMKMVDALIKEGKLFDLLVIPEATHWYIRGGNKTGRYIWGKVIPEYFLEHLKSYKKE